MPCTDLAFANVGHKQDDAAKFTIVCVGTGQDWGGGGRLVNIWFASR